MIDYSSSSPKREETHESRLESGLDNKFVVIRDCPTSTALRVVSGLQAEQSGLTFVRHHYISRQLVSKQY